MKILRQTILVQGFLLALLPNSNIAQTFTGNIKNLSNGAPIPYASIGITRKNTGCVSDSAGNFALELSRNLDYADTVIISSIGYFEKKYRLREFIAQKIIFLKPAEELLNEVKVISFRNETVLGSLTKRRNLNSGWSGPGKGGEIGNVFAIGINLFKIEKVSFYILTGCDTTLFRLHIREFIDGHPGDELLTGNIFLQVTKQDGVSEHDLSKFNIIISDKPKIYISLELLNRSRSVSDTKLGNNVHITGHKGGVLHYKWYPQTLWLKNEDYELSLILKAKY